MVAELTALRDQIDEVDKALLSLLAKRLELVAEVGEVKSQYGLPIYVPEREAAMLASRREEAAALGVPPDLIEDVLRRVMRESYSSENDKGFKTLHPNLRPVVIVGGGNVAMDAARSALRLGAETVYIVYRRGMAELPARKEEVEHAEEEGIIFKTLCNPVEIHANDEGFVKSITCIEMELGEPDASGRRRPIEKKGSEFELDVDTVIMSLGTSPNPLIRSTTPGLETNKHGCIVTDGDDGKTSRDGVYAGGDAVTGAATVIKAMGAGKAAAKAIDEYIQSK